MAVLSATERDKVWRAFMRLNTEPTGFNKTLLRSGVDATDDFIDGIAASYNTALPVGIRGSGSTLQQKTMLFCMVAMRRAGLLDSEGN